MKSALDFIRAAGQSPRQTWLSKTWLSSPLGRFKFVAYPLLRTVTAGSAPMLSQITIRIHAVHHLPKV
jgi:hypothetical protein